MLFSILVQIYEICGKFPTKIREICGIFTANFSIWLGLTYTKAYNNSPATLIIITFLQSRYISKKLFVFRNDF